MSLRTTVCSSNQQPLAARVQDLLRVADQKGHPAFSAFLDEDAVLQVERMLKRTGCLLFGGHPACARRMLGVFPEPIPVSESAFPLCGLTARFPSSHPVGHRDVLGSLMGLGLSRDSVGDIFVGKGACTLFVRVSVAPLLVQEWTQIGRTGIRLSDQPDVSLCKQPDFRELTGTVASLRLDAVVGVAAGFSRSRAADMIRAGMVRLGGLEQTSGSAPVREGDRFSIKGHGKYRLAGEPRLTRKGRLLITIHQYI